MVMLIMNRIKVLEAIHAHLPEAFVLMTTANVDDDFVKQATEKGVSGEGVQAFSKASALDILHQARELHSVRIRTSLAIFGAAE